MIAHSMVLRLRGVQADEHTLTPAEGIIEAVVKEVQLRRCCPLVDCCYQHSEK